jgi:hypothetical protein
LLNQIAAIHDGGGAAGGATSYESIASTTVGLGGTGFVEFTSIPSTYKHLQVRMMTRGSISAVGSNVDVQFNSDTGTNYWTHFLEGNGSAASSYSAGGGSTVGIYAGWGAAANAGSNIFGAGVWDILDYTNTNKVKVIRALSGIDNNGSGILLFNSGSWSGTAAITSMKIQPNSGTFSQYSSFALYGIKG